MLHKILGKPKTRTKPDRIVFLHIPKSAGSSVSEGLAHTRFRHKALGLYDEIIFGDFKDFGSIHEAIRAKLIHLPETRVDPEWGAVSGHLSLPTIMHHFPKHRIFTVMREPRSRLVSFWLYWRATSPHHLKTWGTWANTVARSYGPFGEFIGMPELAAQTDNLVVRMLLGKHPLIPSDDFIHPSSDAKLISDSCKALQSIGFVGLNEDKTLSIKIGNFVGESYELPRSNVTEPPPESRRVNLTEELSAWVIDTLYARTRLDQVLWTDVAKKVFSRPDSASEHALLSTLFRHMENTSADHSADAAK